MPNTTRFSPGRRLVHSLLAACLFVCCGLAAAAPPPQKTQVPGYYRLMLGSFELTALYDGYLDLEAKLLKNASAAEIQRLLARMFTAGDKVQTAVNTYLVNTGSHLVLVDTGTAKLFGPSLGFVIDNLKAAGYEPAQLDTVLLTHLHPDHVNGLLGADGKPVFANAEIRVAQAESDYWLSAERAAKAPANAQPFFKMAQTAAAPYQAAGKWKPFAGEAEIVPGIRAVAAAGHTPGHTAYALSSGGKQLLILGDVVHNAAVQFARPGVAIEFDVDQKQAVITRQRLFAKAAREKLLVSGMHLPFPGIGHLRAEGKGYVWVPVEFGPIRE